ncbi:hypothetical protein SELMODRAFT_428542 [Selaginella moellendorffii]|uniref:Uncharacterized protein n=1 Tax=Selaginella moellendorffii TaxID=88036 RepID=D8T367_SELML|nr:hypothetical protein SELMODRAFT_428542 [Selaginella moellendorffii]
MPMDASGIHICGEAWPARVGMHLPPSFHVVWNARTERIANKYGPIISLRLGMILISSPELTKEVFTTDDLNFASRPYIVLAQQFSYNFAGAVEGLEQREEQVQDLKGDQGLEAGLEADEAEAYSLDFAPDDACDHFNALKDSMKTFDYLRLLEQLKMVLSKSLRELEDLECLWELDSERHSRVWHGSKSDVEIANTHMLCYVLPNYTRIVEYTSDNEIHQTRRFVSPMNLALLGHYDKFNVSTSGAT